MNIIRNSVRVCSLALAMHACFATPASAQVIFPQTLSSARRACVPSHAPRYTPGHYETVQERVRIPGISYQTWVPAQYRTHYGFFGHRYRRLISPGHYVTHRTPDRYEYRSRKVWVAGHYSY